MGRLTAASRSGARARRAGFTLVELMLASVLLSIGLMAMLALQMHAMTGSQVGRHYTQAAQVARDLMEELHRVPWAAARAQPTAGWVADPVASNDVQLEAGGTSSEQTYTVEYRIQVDPVSPADLRLIDVRVTWYEARDPAPPAPPRRRYAITSVRFDDGN
jgi:prepilin-type N-terminal cleavage/methylation domain-containing protein